MNTLQCLDVHFSINFSKWIFRWWSYVISGFIFYSWYFFFFLFLL